VSVIKIFVKPLDPARKNVISQGAPSKFGTKIALLTAMVISPPEKEHSTPPSAFPGAKWFELGMQFLPSILKLLAALGLFKTAHARLKARQDLKTRRARKLATALADAEERNRWA